MKQHCYLNDFQIIRPQHELEQEKILDWIAKAHTEAESHRVQWGRGCVKEERFHQNIKKLLYRLGSGKGKITKRAVQISDLFLSNDDCREIYDINSKQLEGMKIQDRNQFYQTHTEAIFEQFYPKGCSAPDHLIHVTCTGYIAPSSAQRIVAKRDFHSKTAVTHAYHMGCYAAFPAIRMAKGFAHDKNRVDIVHTEMCSLHMNPLNHNLDQLVVQSLFADGFIRYSANDTQTSPSLELCALHEELIPYSYQEMSWSPDHWGMSMSLSAKVPELISSHLEIFLKQLAEKAQVDWNMLKEKALFAIHPGGPKIIDSIAEKLELSSEQLYFTYDVFTTHGNMSSATVPHMWAAILKDDKILNDRYIISLAAGPGLTLTGALLKKVV